jgi:hypothetical protein
MALSEIEILRLEHGDNNPDYPLMTDDEYSYFINTYPNKRKRAKAIDLALLNALSYDVRERSGQEERHAHQAFQQRMALLDKKYKDPAFNGAQSGILVGGVFKDEMAEIALNPNVVPDAFYKGQNKGVPHWRKYPTYFFCGYSYTGIELNIPHPYVFINSPYI